ncbi:MAG: long-chain fatty acid--CoA ligase [Clostridia bacterium]|nr:long-chain fatty acid--CoA ligase [Clostridia bacterium]
MFYNEIINNCPASNIALRTNGESISYGQLEERIERFCSFFHKSGINAGDYLGLYAGNSPEFVYTYLAASKLGAVIVPFNRMLTGNEVEYIAEDADMKYIVTMKPLEISPRYQQFVLPKILDDILETDIVALPEFSRDIHDVNTIIYTSGTTGKPKGAMLTHENLVSNAKSVIDHFDFSVEDIHLCVLPMFHSFAWTVSVTAALYSGATVVIEDVFHPKNILQRIQEEKVTVISGVPAMYSYYVSLGHKEDFDSVRVFISGGASLPVEILENFEKKFDKKICEGYGLSESSPVVSINPMHRTKPGSIGLPIKDVHVKIVNDKGQDLPTGTAGEILVMGPNVMKGYKNLPEETKKTIVDAWLHTGDIGYLDEDGYIYIVDRIKDIIIVSGLNVYPREIEELIYQYGGVLEAAVIGIPDKKRGEVPMAYIAVENRDTFDLEGLEKHLNDNLAQFKWPKKITIMESLPKNATGKIMKRALKE